MKTTKILELFWQKSRNSRYLLREKEIAVLYYILNQFDKEGWPESVTVSPVEIAKQLVDYSGYIGGYLNNLERAGIIIGGGYTLSLPQFDEDQQGVESAQGVESQEEGVVGSHKEVETVADVEVQVVQEVEVVQKVQKVEEVQQVQQVQEVQEVQVVQEVETAAKPEESQGGGAANSHTEKSQVEKGQQEPCSHRSPTSNIKYEIRNNSPPVIYTNRIYTNKRDLYQ